MCNMFCIFYIDLKSRIIQEDLIQQLSSSNCLIKNMFKAKAVNVILSSTKGLFM